jgi:hypothetical protein
MWYPVAAQSKESLAIGLVGVAQMSFFDSHGNLSGSFKMASEGKLLPLGSALFVQTAQLGLVTGVIKLESLDSVEAGKVFKVLVAGEEVHPMMAIKPASTVHLPVQGASCLFLANFQSDGLKVRIIFCHNDNSSFSFNLILNKGVCLVPLDEMQSDYLIDPDVFLKITSSNTLLVSLLRLNFDQ